MRKGNSVVSMISLGLLASVALDGCVRDNEKLATDAGSTFADGDADGDTDGDSDGDDTECVSGDHLACDENGDVASYDSCDAFEQVVDDCADAHGACEEDDAGAAACGCVPNWSLANGCATCVTGFGGAECAVCEVGYEGGSCANCHDSYNYKDLECVYDDYCGSDREWLAAGDLPAPVRLTTEMAAGGTYGEPTLADSVTGLEWRRCALGQTWNGSACAGELDTSAEWFGVVPMCNGAWGGHEDWRIPDLTEIMTLMSHEASPYFLTGAFPEIGTTSLWTSTVSPFSSEDHFRFATAQGQWIILGSAAVLCVRGGDSDAQPPRRFFAAAEDGSTVLDAWSGLEWRRCAAGQTWDGAACVGEASPVDWEDIADACQGDWGGHEDWSPPDIVELRSLLLHCRETRPFHLEVMPGLDTAEYFWSATEGQASSLAFGLGFDHMTGDLHDKDDELFVLCRREPN